MKDQQDNMSNPHPVKLSIHIDKKQYFATKNPMTGAELKKLGGVAQDMDLWKEVHGQGDDIKIEDSTSVTLHEGDHFYSAPRTLNPGGNYIYALA